MWYTGSPRRQKRPLSPTMVGFPYGRQTLEKTGSIDERLLPHDTTSAVQSLILQFWSCNFEAVHTKLCIKLLPFWITISHLSFGPPPRCPQVVWCHWREIEPFSATLAQDGLVEYDQPGKNLLKCSAVVGNWTRATGRTDSELSHWAIKTDCLKGL